MLRTTASAALLALTLLLATAAAAEDGCERTTSDPEVDTGDTPVGRYYVDNDPCQPGCLYSVWIYPETNGEDGLQRQDEMKDDTCGQYDGDGWAGY